MPPSSNHDSVAAEPDISSTHTAGSVTSAADAEFMATAPATSNDKVRSTPAGIRNEARGLDDTVREPTCAVRPGVGPSAHGTRHTAHGRRQTADGTRHTAHPVAHEPVVTGSLRHRCRRIVGGEWTPIDRCREMERSGGVALTARRCSRSLVGRLPRGSVARPNRVVQLAVISPWQRGAHPVERLDDDSSTSVGCGGPCRAHDEVAARL